MAIQPVKQNNIPELPYLENFRYENLFNVYQTADDKYFYNLLSKVNFPEEIDETFYTIYTVPNDSVSWTFISNKFYGTTLLWWLICSANKIQNPVYFPAPGTELKILNPSVVRNIIQQVISQQ